MRGPQCKAVASGDSPVMLEGGTKGTPSLTREEAPPYGPPRSALRPAAGAPLIETFPQEGHPLGVWAESTHTAANGSPQP